MAFTHKIGNLFKKATASNLSVYQAIRSMSSSKLFVGGLSYGTDDQSLREAFTSYGEVVEARVIIDRETGRSRGFGFVTFTSTEEASAAMTGMDGKDLHGRMVRVNYAAERRGFRGGYGGGGGGYGGAGYGAGGGYGGGSYGGGGGSYSAGEGYGGGGYGGASNYSGDTYGSGGGGYGGGSTGGYGGSSGGGDHSVAGGSGGSDSYVGGAPADNYASSVGGAAGGYGGSGGYDGSGATDYGSSGNQYSSNTSSADAGYEKESQDNLLDDSFKDEDDEPDNYANKRS